MSDIGNELDAIFKPGWLTAVHAVEALAKNADGTVAGELQTIQADVANALSGASQAVAAAQSKVVATVNPIVNDAITAAGSAITAAYPPFGPLVAAAEGEVEKLADAGSDAILIELINKAAGLLSNAGKTVAAINLRNLVGAQ